MKESTSQPRAVKLLSVADRGGRRPIFQTRRKRDSLQTSDCDRQHFGARQEATGVKRLLDETKKAFGKLDVLVNNAASESSADIPTWVTAFAVDALRRSGA